MTFDTFLNGQTAIARRTIETAWEQAVKVLNETGTGRQFVINVEAESRLAEGAWQTLVKALPRAAVSTTTLKTALTGACRPYTLKGAALPPPTPEPLGRAVTKAYYVELLRAQFGFTRKRDAKQFMHELLKPDTTVAENHDRLRRKLLTKAGRLMWATFDGTHPGGDPFAQMPPHADGIRAQLGLDLSDEGKDLLLFRYTLPSGTPARFPTIADAYAGDTWPYFFRPSRASETCGWTMTWPSCQESPCPEVVHAPVTGAQLVEPVALKENNDGAPSCR